MPDFRDGEPTPEFVRWTLGRPCRLREDYDWTNPEQAERLLRSVRAVGDARREGRIYHGIAFRESPPLCDVLEEVRGFIVDEALALFGAESEIVALCSECPANVAGQATPTLAGCYGMFYSADAAAFHRVVSHAVEELNLDTELHHAFPHTNPWWYAFWITPQLNETQCQCLVKLFAAIAERTQHTAPGLNEFLDALQISLRADLPLFVRLLPSGRLQNGVWKLDSHCKRCTAPRPLGDRMCRVCGIAGEVCAGRTRKMRGGRPFHPLSRQLSLDRLRAIVAGYNTSSTLAQ